MVGITVLFVEADREPLLFRGKRRVRELLFCFLINQQKLILGGRNHVTAVSNRRFRFCNELANFVDSGTMNGTKLPKAFKERAKFGAHAQFFVPQILQEISIEIFSAHEVLKVVVPIYKERACRERLIELEEHGVDEEDVLGDLVGEETGVDFELEAVLENPDHLADYEQVVAIVNHLRHNYISYR
jgi:hypothetical protein